MWNNANKLWASEHVNALTMQTNVALEEAFISAMQKKQCMVEHG
jgi:hypothetical protein